MTIQNLVIVFAPNLLSVPGKDLKSEKAREVVDAIFKNESKIGMVPEEIVVRALAVASDGALMSSSGNSFPVPQQE